MNDTTTVNTEYGPVRVPTEVLRLWNLYGWPTDEILRHMAEEHRFIRAALGQVERDGEQP